MGKKVVPLSVPCFTTLCSGRYFAYCAVARLLRIIFIPPGKTDRTIIATISSFRFSCTIGSSPNRKPAAARPPCYRRKSGCRAYAPSGHHHLLKFHLTCIIWQTTPWYPKQPVATSGWNDWWTVHVQIRGLNWYQRKCALKLAYARHRFESGVRW